VIKNEAINKATGINAISKAARALLSFLLVFDTGSISLLGTVV